ncbi:tyrosine-type recombinase/integrase [Bifidobacterium miconisargentati]|uniref:tyrosine-type recombinase/integrase n=1 Tax=Bifidobacterium miconisargentati TaxID=2834437 RepID=UPI001BDC29CF|nr:tyrosine-type recombinase/integrase [Bifidobacterium miconisargentati]MBW3091340.1 tyrosine-type recombinase/integrase [Bifidobacterium miconisargentati]
MPDRTRAAACLAIGCGLRESEACALRRKDINLRKRTVTVWHSLGRGEKDRGFLRLKPPKTTSSYRTVVIPDDIMPDIVAHLAMVPEDPDAFMFTGEQSSILPPSTLRKHFDQVKGLAGREDAHFHTLRATYDSGLHHIGGATLAETMEASGHTAVTVEAIYQRSDPERMRQAANRWGAYLNQSTRPSHEELDKRIAEAREWLRQLESEAAALTD